MGSSDINVIIDYTASIAASVPGVKAVAGSGSGNVDDPLRPGHKIVTAEANPVTPFLHWSEVPGAPPVEWVSQNGTVEISWHVPMRLWLPHSSSEARRLALPFYDGYLRAFTRDPFLGDRTIQADLALRTAIVKFAIGGDANWSWLDVGLLVVERVNYLE